MFSCCNNNALTLLSNRPRILRSYTISIKAYDSYTMYITNTTLLIPYDTDSSYEKNDDVPLALREYKQSSAIIFSSSRIVSKRVSKIEIINYFNTTDKNVLCIEVTS